MAATCSLYPMFIVGLVLMTAYRLTQLTSPDPEVLTAWGATFLFNAAFLPISWITWPFILGPAWSLSCEAFANILYAYLCVSGMSMRKALLPALIGMTYVVLVGIKYGNLDVGFLFSNIGGGVARTLFSFFVGVAVYLSQHLIPTVGVFAALLCGAILVFCLSVPIPEDWRFLHDLFAIFIAFPAIVAIGSAVQLPRTSLPICAFLGRASYPAYVLHLPLLSFAFLVMIRFCGASAGPIMLQAVWAIVGLMMVIAWAVDFYLDEPFRKKFF